MNTDKSFEHICEVCDKTLILTSEEAFQMGWDYPPRMGVVGVISPRTCGECGIDSTLWWELVARKTPVADLSVKQQKVLARILDEPNFFDKLDKVS